MEDRYKTYLHNPPHLFRDGAKYFITGAIYDKKHFMIAPETKKAVLKYLFKSFEVRNWKIEEWVLLDNHYHLISDAANNAADLSIIINNFHKFSGLWIKKHVAEAAAFSPIFYNYWDSCITYEKSYFARINYIWHNPVKHGYVSDPKDWPYGSYSQRYHDRSSMQHIIDNYPCDKVNVYDDF